MSRLSLDANVLIYGVDAGDPAKHRTARRVIRLAAKRDCVLTLQALAEFYFVATRKGKLGAPQVKAQVGELRSVFPMALPSGRTLSLAIDASERHRIGFWDGMLIAVAQEAGVGILLTEDLQDEQVYEGVRCVNPFTRSARQLDRLVRWLAEDYFFGGKVRRLNSRRDLRVVHLGARDVEAVLEMLRLCPDILNSEEELAQAATRLGDILKAL